jgi:signal recognition particle subunit SRP54
LLDADVALPVVKTFTDAVKARAIGIEVTKSLTPGQAFIKVVHEELTRLMGEPSTGLNLRAQRPVVVHARRAAGRRQDHHAGKLARWLIEKQHKKVLMVSTDVYRPAAILQLQTLATQVGAGFAPALASEAPVAIAKTRAHRGHAAGLRRAAARHRGPPAHRCRDDGRGQRTGGGHQSARTAVRGRQHGRPGCGERGQGIQRGAELTGVILTKADGDARGGAALSVRQVTGKPILFVGTGEKSEALELFQPERIASRILGMGDVLSLVEQVQGQVDQEKAEKLAKKISKGKSFDLADLRDQLSQLQNMGGMSALLDKLPAQLQANAAAAAGAVNAKSLKRQMGIIDSMTPRERRRPESSTARASAASRRRRGAAAGGQPPAEAVRPDAKDHEKARQGRHAEEHDARDGGPFAARIRALRASRGRPPAHRARVRSGETQDLLLIQRVALAPHLSLQLAARLCKVN